MGKGGVDTWAQIRVMEALEANPSRPVEIPTHGTTTSRLFAPSYGLNEAVETAFTRLIEEGRRTDFREYERILNHGSGKGPYPRLLAILEDEGDVGAEKVRDALIKDFIAQYALDSAKIRAELDRRQRACTEAAA